ncbi:cytochrome P450 [Amylibacter sp. SFDW26]|uniref:cytochrome P450 n=1 Tax=Amylibacter sp. SFDW26 TaxID=2652722 RepID=UPI0012614045|nr:cytochrome P450 [Amylibacter sp. SFDW26]KAB7615946.1 cytochrome P450 [Amylibacter sp. SFDW26]
MSFKPTTDSFIRRPINTADPGRVYDNVRAEGDILWSSSMRIWLVLSKSAATEALRNRDLHTFNLSNLYNRLARQTEYQLEALAHLATFLPIVQEGERHKKLRSLFGRFLADNQDAYLSAYAQSSRELLDTLKENGGGDFATEYADRIHSDAIGRICDIAPERRAWMAQKTFAEGILGVDMHLSSVQNATIRVRELFSHYDEVLRSSAENDILANMGQHFEAAGMPADHDSKASFLTALTVLGGDTTAGTLSLGLGRLLDAFEGRISAQQWPDQKNLVEEFLRLSAAIQTVYRVANKPTMIADQNIAKGETVLINLSAANRDPTAYECPHQFNENHQAGIQFGTGRHFCSGMTLTRKAVAISLEHLSEFSEIVAREGRSFSEDRIATKYSKFPITLE